MGHRFTVLEILALVVAIIGSGGLIYICIIFYINTDPITNANGFNNEINLGITSALGSLISGVGALFTLASVIYFVASLKISQKDLIRTAQNQNLHQFENTFFKLIDLHNSITENLIFQDLNGRSVFSSAVSSLKGATQYYWTEFNGSPISIDHELAPPPSTLKKARQKLNSDYYDYYYKKYEFTLNHYFRSLYHVFKYLHNANLTQDEKETYAAIARSKLSQDELHLIMFNSLHRNYGYPKMLLLIKEFDVLDNFNHTLVSPQVYYKLYLNEIKEVEKF